MAKLDDLPQELKELILCAASDIATLKCLAHLSPLFHGVYTERLEYIFLTVLSTEIGPDILHEARMVARASTIERGPSWFSDVKQLLANYDKGIDKSFPLDITSAEFIYISRFLPALHYVTLAFSQVTLSHHPLTGEKMHPPSPNRFEIRRIQRSILRIEIFNILFSERNIVLLIVPIGSPLAKNSGISFCLDLNCGKLRKWQYDVVFRDCSVELRKWFALNEYCEEDPGDSMENAVARTEERESPYTGKEKPNLAWLWSVQQWNPAFDGGNWVSCYERRDCLRSWGYVMWDSSRLESLAIMNCKIQDMQPHRPKAIQEPLLTDRPKMNEG
ncbi:hypothetical protein BCON_0051g00310 [Botryotinia convoluta]|uniref:F-box domain-containing protein n=1 Tax=Botryotinia convoluta TaxID=54673 RepID=A0A4Z1IB08_9HELO|nr:hypothetical protein BCON_0051g00310 [Botryotinia convoluta]